MEPTTPRPRKVSQRDTAGLTTPQRRSIQDLQILIDELFEKVATTNEDGIATCRCADLPAVLAAFESRRKIVFLDSNEKASLENFAQLHPDLDVSSEQLVSLLAAMTPQTNTAGPDSPSPAPRIGTNDIEETNGVLQKRVRSTSLSSGSSRHSRDSTMLTGQGTMDDEKDEGLLGRSVSVPTHLSSRPSSPLTMSQPRARTTSGPEQSEVTETGLHRAAHIRRDSSQRTPISNSTFFSRQRSSPLEPQSMESLRRSRPAPPKSRRVSGDGFGKGNRSRQNSEEPELSSPHTPMDMVSSPSFLSLDSMQEEAADAQYALFPVSESSRSIEGKSARSASPNFGLVNFQALGSVSPPFAPSSPDIVVPTSFHAKPTSPPSANLFGDESDFDLTSSMRSIHSRPVSTASLGSETAMAEMIQQLQQELARKTQQLEAQKADGYASVVEKEALLEEARAELASKRREEKELRSRERLTLSQIASLEAQTATFRDDRDKQKAAYQNSRKQFEEQCNESEKLRNIIRSKDEDLRSAEENVQNSASELSKVTRERDYLQTTISRLEAELAEAKETINILEEQKQENLQLRETIDRLRLELDEMRAQNQLGLSAKGSSMALSRSASGSDGLPASLTRNLGRELALRLQASSSSEAEDHEPHSDRDKTPDAYEEEIVTTRRRLKRPVKKTEATADSKAQPLTTPIEMVDVQIQVKPTVIPTEDSTTQTDIIPELSAVEKRRLLARDLQVDLAAVDAYIEEKKQNARLEPHIPDTAPPPYHISPNSWQYRLQPYTDFLPSHAHTLKELIVSSTSNLIIYSLLVFFSGFVTAAINQPVHHHHHFDSYADWSAYNTLDLGPRSIPSFWSEGLLFWAEKVVWRGISIARRVPT